jgi:glycogen debranching enzyme
MRIKHTLGEQSAEKDVDGGSFLISNKNGGFCWLDNEARSRYQGVFFSLDGKMFRVIEFIGRRDFNKIENKFFCVERSVANHNEKFFMPDLKNSFVYEGDGGEFTLDFKDAYGGDYSGYFLENYDRGFVVKFNYRGEDYYLAVRFQGEFVKKETRVDRFYVYDKNRSSHPFERNVYCPGEIKSKKIVFSFSRTKDGAIIEADDVFANTERYEDEKLNRIKNTAKNISNEKVNMAYNSARFSLDGLCDNKGMFAGYPWFFQYWARDELISFGAYYDINKDLCRDFVKKWSNVIGEEFAISAKEKIDGSFEGKSVDAVGWLFKRMELYPELMQEQRSKIDNFLSHLSNDFIETRGESWMDSIQRSNGIEIQAMKLYILRMAGKITNKGIFSEKERIFREIVRAKYFDGEFLYDADDRKIRPNIFIAYYFYPELLSREEWERVIDNELKELWCEWGGVSSLSKKDSLYKNDYSGEIPGSYHNGDSWFWINNLAGWVLTDLNKEKYYEKIKKILSASTDEILFSGAVGHHAELSSASALRSEGAVSQAFSAGMFVEFVDKLVNV